MSDFFIDEVNKYFGSALNREVKDCSVDLGAEFDAFQDAIGDFWKGHRLIQATSSPAPEEQTSEKEPCNQPAKPAMKRACLGEEQDRNLERCTLATYSKELYPALMVT